MNEEDCERGTRRKDDQKWSSLEESTLTPYSITKLYITTIYNAFLVFGVQYNLMPFFSLSAWEGLRAAPTNLVNVHGKSTSPKRRTGKDIPGILYCL